MLNPGLFHHAMTEFCTLHKSQCIEKPQSSPARHQSHKCTQNSYTYKRILQFTQFIWSQVTTQVTPPLQIHSLTARSVPRQFREGLKHSKPDVTDRNIRVKQQQQPHNLATAHGTTGHSWSQHQMGGGGGGGSEEEEFRLNIVYDSENKHLVPYPDGDYVR